MKTIRLNVSVSCIDAIVNNSRTVHNNNGVISISSPTHVIDGNAYPLFLKAKENGSEIITATVDIESRLCDIIELFLFKKKDSPEAEFFRNEILDTTTLTFQDRKRLVCSIAKKCTAFVGKKQNEFEKALKDIQTYRNAFAHGELKHSYKKDSIILFYYSGEKKEVVLDDNFWETIEVLFSKATELLVILRNKVI